MRHDTVEMGKKCGFTSEPSPGPEIREELKRKKRERMVAKEKGGNKKKGWEGIGGSGVGSNHTGSLAQLNKGKQYTVGQSLH